MQPLLLQAQKSEEARIDAYDSCSSLPLLPSAESSLSLSFSLFADTMMVVFRTSESHPEIPAQTCYEPNVYLLKVQMCDYLRLFTHQQQLSPLVSFRSDNYVV